MKSESDLAPTVLVRSATVGACSLSRVGEAEAERGADRRTRAATLSSGEGEKLLKRFSKVGRTLGVLKLRQDPPLI